MALTGKKLLLAPIVLPIAIFGFVLGFIACCFGGGWLGACEFWEHFGE